MHSVYFYIGTWAIGVVSNILAPLNQPITDAAPTYNSNVFLSVGTAISAFWVVADLNFMFAALGFLLGWRAVWFTLRLYRIVLELIPMLG